jgi:hypothetical protein
LLLLLLLLLEMMLMLLDHQVLGTRRGGSRSIAHGRDVFQHQDSAAGPGRR